MSWSFVTIFRPTHRNLKVQSVHIYILQDSILLTLKYTFFKTKIHTDCIIRFYKLA